MKTEIADTKHLNILGNGDSLSNREVFTALLKQWRQKLGYFTMFTALPAILTSFAQEAQADEAKKPEASVAGQTTRLLERVNKRSGKPEFLRRRSNFLLPHQKGNFDITSVLAGGDNCPGNAIPAGTYTAAAPFTDSGDTTGANNTVNSIPSFYYSTYDTAGPDHIYSFTLTGRGPNPQIQVSTTSATYQPAIYILDSRSGPCPAGTGNFASNSIDAFYSSFAFIDQQTVYSLPLNTPLYLFVDSRTSGANGSGPYTVRIQDVTIAPVGTPPRKRFDFDGDGRADLSVFNPSNGVWSLQQSQNGFVATQFGLSTDKITPADFDGDGKTDIAVFRDGTWYWLNSSNGAFNAYQFGQAGDIPVPADFTGDGRAELAVYRDGTWYTLNLAGNQFQAVQFGLPTDKPVPADFDGDGKTDFAVYRDGTWYLLRSLQGFAAVQFGLAADKPVVGDYDADGKADQAVYRNGIWYVLRSQQGFIGVQLGGAGDVPVAADYDGDSKTDFAVFRDGVWRLLSLEQGFVRSVQFGLAGDKPIPAAFVP
jgi:hypothetical protein